MSKKNPVKVKAAPAVTRESAETEKAVASELLYKGEPANLEELFKKGEKIDENDRGTGSRDNN